MDELDARFNAGCAAVLAGGRLARRHFENLDQLQVETKGPQDHASAADREVEALMAGLLRGAFPDDSVFGDEGGGWHDGSQSRGKVRVASVPPPVAAASAKRARSP